MKDMPVKNCTMRCAIVSSYWMVRVLSSRVLRDLPDYRKDGMDPGLTISLPVYIAVVPIHGMIPMNITGEQTAVEIGYSKMKQVCHHSHLIIHYRR